MRGRRAIPRLFVALLLALPVPALASAIQLGESGGIYTVPVQINGSVTSQFLVDPGSAVVVIPRSILRSLVLNGTVTDRDIVGASIAELADSTLYEAVHVRLRELKVGDVILHDVVAAVSPALTQPLLGQTFLGRFASITFDNQRHLLILNDAGAAAATSQYSATVQTAPMYPPTFSGSSDMYGQPNYWRSGR